LSLFSCKLIIKTWKLNNFSKTRKMYIKHKMLCKSCRFEFQLSTRKYYFFLRRTILIFNMNLVYVTMTQLKIIIIFFPSVLVTGTIRLTEAAQYVGRTRRCTASCRSSGSRSDPSIWACSFENIFVHFIESSLKEN